MVRGVPREDVGEPGLDADPDQREPARRLPALGLRELRVAELDADLGVRRRGVRLGQAHRHVEVRRPAGVRTLEDRHHEPGVDGVDDVGDAVLLDEPLHRRRVGGVDLGGRGTVVLAGRLLRPREVVVGDHERVVEVAPGDDRGERPADATGPDQQDPHEAVLTDRCRT